MYSGELRTYKVGKTTMAEPEPARPTLFGNVLETQFEFEGHQFWICADYYPEFENRYLVSYKIGLAGSWFATAFEYGSFFEDIYVECAEDKIVDTLRGVLETKKEYAAKRYLESVYELMYRWELPEHRKLYAQAKERFVSRCPAADVIYHPFEGIRRSVLVRTKGNLYYCGHFSEDESHLQLFGTETDSAYIVVGEMEIPDKSCEGVEEMLSEYDAKHKFDVHPYIQATQLNIVCTVNPRKPESEELIVPYREKEIKLWLD